VVYESNLALTAKVEKMREALDESRIIAKEWGGFEHNRIMNKAVERLKLKLAVLDDAPKTQEKKP